jgi:hypothetical protein
MEDFLMPHASRSAVETVEEPAFAGHADFGATAPVAAGPSENRAPRISLAELRVLAAGAMLPGQRAAAGPGGATLDEADRRARLEDLASLWQAGCRRLVDETLYRDIAARHPELARTVRRRLRRRLATT